MDCKSSNGGPSMTELQKLASANHALVQCLFSASEHDDHSQAIHILRDIKNLTIGSDKQKRSMLILQLFNRLISTLLQMRGLDEKAASSELQQTQIEHISVLCSLIKLKATSTYAYSGWDICNNGEQNHRQQLDDLTVYLIDGMTSSNDKLAETCARCLRCLFAAKMVSPQLLFEPIENEMDTGDSNPIFAYTAQDTALDRLMKVFSDCSTSKVVFVISCLCSLLDHDDVTESAGGEQYDWLKLKGRQNILVTRTCLLQIIPSLLLSGKHALMEATLDLIMALSAENVEIASKFVTELPSNCYGSNKSSNSDGSKMSCVSIICDNIRWDKPRKQQMQCCRVLINFLNLGVLHPSWPRFTHKVLPSLVRMCKKDCHPKHRIEAAMLIYQLTQASKQLQMSAIITERLVALLIKYLAFNTEADCATTVKDEVKYFDGMRVAAFKALSALSANEHHLPRHLVEDSLLMDSVMLGLTDVNPKVQFSAMLLMLSFSRSIPLLLSHLKAPTRQPSSPAVQQHHIHVPPIATPSSSLPSVPALALVLTDPATVNAVFRPVLKVLTTTSNSVIQMPTVPNNTLMDSNSIGLDSLRSSQQPITAQKNSSSHRGGEGEVTLEDIHAEMREAARSDNLALISSAVMCNLTLPFLGERFFAKSSVTKEELLAAVCPLLSCANMQLRLNSVWILMNFCYEAPADIISAVWNTVLVPPDLLHCLLTDPFYPVRVKTAALLQNLTATTSVLEEVMSRRGNDVMTCVAAALDQRGKEQLWHLPGDSRNFALDGISMNYGIAGTDLKGERHKLGGLSDFQFHLLKLVSNICTVNSLGFQYVIDRSDLMTIIQHYLMRFEFSDKLSDVQVAILEWLRICVSAACAADGAEQILGGSGASTGPTEGGYLFKLTLTLQRHGIVDALKYIATLAADVNNTRSANSNSFPFSQTTTNVVTEQQQQQQCGGGVPPPDRDVSSSPHVEMVEGDCEDFPDSGQPLPAFSPPPLFTGGSTSRASFADRHPYELNIVSALLQKVS